MSQITGIENFITMTDSRNYKRESMLNPIVSQDEAKPSEVSGGIAKSTIVILDPADPCNMPLSTSAYSFRVTKNCTISSGLKDFLKRVWFGKKNQGARSFKMPVVQANNAW